jgi:hypothetical protein
LLHTKELLRSVIVANYKLIVLGVARDEGSNNQQG